MGMWKVTAVVACLAIVALLGAYAADKIPASGSGGVSTPEAWQKEFEDVCSKTQDAMIFSVEELKTLVQRCDALEPKIEKLDETRRKVYLKRLRQCRGLFAYVLESKAKAKK